MRIVLPWPNPKLNPNKRLHWAPRSKAAKADRALAGTITRANIYVTAHQLALPDPLPLTITFFPPDKRKRDRDNMIASMKATMDGVADALGVDDSRFVPTYQVGEPVKGGRVLVEVLI